MMEFVSNGVDISMCPMITQFGIFFLRGLRCSELNFLLSEFLVTLLKEQALSSYQLHPLCLVSFNNLSTSQTLQIPNKIITKFVEASEYHCFHTDLLNKHLPPLPCFFI